MLKSEGQLWRTPAVRARMASQKLSDRGPCPLREQKQKPRQEEPREGTTWRQRGDQGHKRPYKSGKV